MTQDSRVFFNHHVATAPPYQNIWDLREAYAQIGSSTEDWFDLIGDRQMLSFGDERVIGPTDWLNMGRTFDTARVDLHHPGFKVSIFASSVFIARDGVIDHHLEGNNLYGIYTSLTHFIPRATFEPFVLWRVAPGNVPLQENEGHGGLSEITGGARIADTFLGNFEYDVEMNKQTARSAFTRSTPRPQTGMPATSSGAVAIAANPAATSSHLGEELDLIAEYILHTYVF